jgi:succinate dehydrogenase / fumarate reductase cytochrome b subunit
MAIGLFWGCFIPRRFPHLERSVRDVLSVLRMSTIDLEEMTCCPDPLIEVEIGGEAYLALAARNIAEIQQQGFSEVLTVCNGCYQSLSNASKHLSQEDTRTSVNDQLAKVSMHVEPRLPTVEHFALEVHKRLDGVRKAVKYPLTSLRVATHHGCNMLTTDDRMKQPDPLHPGILQKCVEAVGAEVVGYGMETDCCGNNLREFETDESEKMALQKLQRMKEAGANCAVVSCPSCFMQLETRQPLLEKKHGVEVNLPILYLSELLVLAFGRTPSSSGHRVPLEVLELPAKP